MVAIQLDAAKEEQLRSLALSQGEDVEIIVRRIIEDYLDFMALGPDTPEDWAEASALLATEIMPANDWPENESGAPA